MSETRQYWQPKREVAETIAIAGLTFLVADEERLDRFLALSGLSADGIREASSAPGFLTGVMRHIMEDDRIAAAFAAAEGLKAEELAAAAVALGAIGERDSP